MQWVESRLKINIFYIAASIEAFSTKAIKAMELLAIGFSNISTGKRANSYEHKWRQVSTSTLPLISWSNLQHDTTRLSYSLLLWQERETNVFLVAFLFSFFRSLDCLWNLWNTRKATHFSTFTRSVGLEDREWALAVLVCCEIKNLTFTSTSNER